MPDPGTVQPGLSYELEAGQNSGNVYGVLRMRFHVVTWLDSISGGPLPTKFAVRRVPVQSE